MRLQPWVRRVFLSIAVSVIYVFPFSQFGPQLEPPLLDTWFWKRGRNTPPMEFIVVALDAVSHQKLGASPLKPWPRELHAKLIEQLKYAGAKRVLMDFIFSERLDPEIDLRLVEAMKQFPTVIGESQEIAYDVNDDGTFIKLQNAYSSPADIFRRSAEKVALINYPDDQGVVRRFWSGQAQGAARTSMAEAALGDSAKSLPQPGVNDFINYYGPPNSIPTIPYYRALDKNDAHAQKLLKDKIVFVGIEFLTTATGVSFNDMFKTPYRKLTFGVEIHATAAANLLHGNWIRRFPQAEDLSLFILAGALTYFMLLLKPMRAAILLIGSIAAWAVFSYSMFLAGYFIPGVLLMLVVMPVVFLFRSLYYALALRRIETSMGIKIE